MAKDDYYVIAYKILAYLYSQLKKGEKVDAEMIKSDGKLFQINQTYWTYIISNMIDQGYIRGFSDGSRGNGIALEWQLSNCEITPKGIDYLFDNSLMERAKQFLKEVKEITPFL